MLRSFLGGFRYSIRKNILFLLELGGRYSCNETEKKKVTRWGPGPVVWQLDFRRRHDDLTRTREVCDNSYTASTLGRELATKIHIVYIDAVGSCTTCHPTRTWNLHMVHIRHSFHQLKLRCHQMGVWCVVKKEALLITRFN